MTPVHRDPAALLREAFTAREVEGDTLGSAARLGRARLTAAMVVAKAPARPANAWALGLSGVAAAALIGGAAFFNFHPGVSPVAAIAGPIQTAAVTPPPAVIPAVTSTASPAPVAVRVMPPAANRHPKRQVAISKALSPAPAPPALAAAELGIRDSGPGTETPELRLAKSSGGILVRWDGPASSRQYELRKSCLDPRAPASATLAARIRSSDGEWLDTTPDSCGASTTLYEVVPFGLGA